MNPFVTAALAIILKIASNAQVKKAVISLLKELAKRTETPLDDVAVDVLAEVIGVNPGEVSFNRAI